MILSVNINDLNKKKMREQVVPIFGLLEGNKRVIGTAFIIRQGLIVTAAHTFYDEIKDKCYIVSAKRKEEPFEIEVNSEKFILGAPVYERYSWDYKTIDDETYHDLSIFKMPEGLNVESELSFSDVLSGDFRVKGYPFSTANLDTSSLCIISSIMSSNRTYENENGENVTLAFNNCFRIKQTLTYGYSGGPAVTDNRVLGMVVFGPKDPEDDKGTALIKAEYILEIIKKEGLLNQ